MPRKSLSPRHTVAIFALLVVVFLGIAYLIQVNRISGKWIRVEDESGSYVEVFDFQGINTLERNTYGHNGDHYTDDLSFTMSLDGNHVTTVTTDRGRNNVTTDYTIIWHDSQRDAIKLRHWNGTETVEHEYVKYTQERFDETLNQVYCNRGEKECKTP